MSLSEFLLTVDKSRGEKFVGDVVELLVQVEVTDVTHLSNANVSEWTFEHKVGSCCSLFLVC